MRAEPEAQHGFNYVPISAANADRWLEILPENQRPTEQDIERLDGLYLEDGSITTRIVGYHSCYETVGTTEKCYNLILAGSEESSQDSIRSLVDRLVQRLAKEKAPCLILAFSGPGQLAAPELLKCCGFNYFDTMVEFKAQVPFKYRPERRKRKACHDEILTYNPEQHASYEQALANHYNETYGALQQPLPKRTAEKIRTLATEHSMSLYFSLDSDGNISGQAEIFHEAGSHVIYGGSIIVTRRRRGTDLTHQLIRKTSDAAVSLGAKDFHVHVSTWNRASSEVLKSFGFQEYRTLLSRYTQKLEANSAR